MDIKLSDKLWWNFLEEDLQELFKESFLLIDFFRNKIHEEKGLEQFHDYSFLVFPAAKAYEGYLKKAFLELKFITEADYFGKRLRIGKALNPFLPADLEKESIYKKVCDFVGNETLAATLWDTWTMSRNLVFHWFPNEKNAITFEEAERRVNLIIDALDSSYASFSGKGVTQTT